MYLVKTPWWLRALYPGFTWRLPSKEKVLYLTFDDGPHETATPFVLDQLKQYDAKASFFCIGKNVMAHAGIYERILQEGHAVGNHTQQHLNGWKTKDDLYLADIREASLFIRSGLFRPPLWKDQTITVPQTAGRRPLIQNYHVVCAQRGLRHQSHT